MLILFALMAIGFVVFIQKNELVRSNLVKSFILYSLLMIPYASSFFSKFLLYGKFIRLPLLFSIVCFVIAVAYLFLYHFKLKVPKYAIWFFIYVVFSLTNNFIQNGYRAENWVNYNLYEYVFPLAFIILIENLKYDEKDINRLIKILSIVVIGAFLVSIVQMFDPFFYSSVNLTDIETGYRSQRMYGNVYRAYSIFSGMKAADSSIAFGYMFIIFLFLYLTEKRRKFFILLGFVTISAILTFARDLWVVLFVSTLLFVYYKYKKKWILYVFILMIFLAIGSAMFGELIQQTDIYKKRIVSESYTSRIFTPQIYFKYFFFERPLFGYGESSGYNYEFTYFYHVIHVLWFNIMFQNGIVGLLIYLMFLYHIYHRSREVYEHTGNPVFIVLVVSNIVFSCFAPYDLINFYGNYVMFLYLAMNYKLYVERSEITEKSDQKSLATI